MQKPLKVVISGSFRKHMSYIGIALENFRKANIEVLAPLTQQLVDNSDSFIFLTTDDSQKTAYVLEKEYMANIVRADFLYLANVGGYIGRSAAAEMATAITNNIPIIASEETLSFSNEVPENVQRILKHSICQHIHIHNIDSKKIAEITSIGFISIELSKANKEILNSLITCLLNDLKDVKIVA